MHLFPSSENKKSIFFSAFTTTAGDINSMWIRDSAVQIGIYLPRIKKHPALRMVIEGAIRAQAFFILQVGSMNDFCTLRQIAE